MVELLGQLPPAAATVMEDRAKRSADGEVVGEGDVVAVVEGAAAVVVDGSVHLKALLPKG
jgi:hypothetical protein